MSAFSSGSIELWSVLQCVAVCCSVLQCVAVRCSAMQCVALCCSVLQSVVVYCSVLQCVAVCCSVLQCVAVCCSVLQCVAVCCSVLQCVAVCCSVLQCVAEHDFFKGFCVIYIRRRSDSKYLDLQILRFPRKTRDLTIDKTNENCGDSRENLFGGYGDSNENLLKFWKS